MARSGRDTAVRNIEICVFAACPIAIMTIQHAADGSDDVCFAAGFARIVGAETVAARSRAAAVRYKDAGPGEDETPRWRGPSSRSAKSTSATSTRSSAPAGRMPDEDVIGEKVEPPRAGTDFL